MDGKRRPPLGRRQQLRVSMSALYGFFGPPDPTLTETMRQAVRHRGKTICHEEVSKHATIGLVTDHDEATCEHLGTGHYVTPDGGLSITLSGQLLAPRDRGRPALPVLLERYREEGTALWPHLRGAFVLARQGGALACADTGGGRGSSCACTIKPWSR